MNKDLFIVDEKNIEEALNKLTMVENIEENHTQLFQDESGQNWQLTKYWIEGLDKNISVLFFMNYVNFNSLYNLMVVSNDVNEIAIISALIYHRKFDNNDKNRVTLLNYLESIYDKSESDNKKIELIIYETELSDSTNRRSVIGKNYQEVKDDYKYYDGIAVRARKLLSKKSR
jgi:hypothetical protein